MKIVEWQSGKRLGHNKYGSLLIFVRNYIKEKFKNTCIQCGFDKPHPTTNKSILQIDHIDGDCTNSQESNLRLLCPNCHAMTDTYCSLNRGISKKSWRKKYRYKVVSDTGIEPVLLT